MRQGAGTDARVPQDRLHVFRSAWASPSPATTGGSTRWPWGQVGGRDVVVSGDYDGIVRLWDMRERSQTSPGLIDFLVPVSDARSEAICSSWPPAKPSAPSLPLPPGPLLLLP
jgi:hypothetical protein